MLNVLKSSFENGKGVCAFKVIFQGDSKNPRKVIAFSPLLVFRIGDEGLKSIDIQRLDDRQYYRWRVVN